LEPPTIPGRFIPIDIDPPINEQGAFKLAIAVKAGLVGINDPACHDYLLYVAANES